MNAVLFARIVLGLTALMWGGHGLLCLFDPETIARESGLALPTTAARVEARAMYGGLELALGLYFASTVFRDEGWSRGLLMVITALGGIAAARALGLLLAGEVDPYNLRALAYETTSVVLAGLALALLRRR